VRELKSLSPTEICEWVKNHGTKRDKKTGKRIQESRKPNSISMWFQRNPDVHRQLEREIEDEEILGEVISETIFYNGAFRKIPCIEKWIMKMRARGAKRAVYLCFCRSNKTSLSR